MRKQCLMFMLLLAASTAVTQELYLDDMRKQFLIFILLAACTAVTQKLYLDEKTMHHVYQGSTLRPI